MQNMSTIIGAVIITIGILVIGIFATTTFQTLKSQEITNEARYQCAQSSRYTVQDGENGPTVWYPVKEMYDNCLEEKGVK